MDSSADPRYLEPGAYQLAFNATARGGRLQTRPGFTTIFNLPQGRLQGATRFKPSSGREHIVFVVNGEVYASQAPFKTYKQVSGLQFNPRSRFVSFAECVQTTTYTDDAIFTQRDKPRRILIIQDGNTRAGYWDGGEARHLNPTPSYLKDPDSGEIITQPLRDETPIGLWMAWAENRLWVANGEKVFASDIGNPLKFTEGTYISEGRYLTMPEDVVGMIQPSSGQPLIIFGNSTLTFVKAYQNRSEWINDTEFQRTEYGIGCVAPRSIVNKLGLIWWYSQVGWINLNYALQSFNDSSVSILDKPMTISKRNLSYDRKGICAGSIEDYTLISVPSGDKWNAHTWVYDSHSSNPGWDGVWTGIRPVQWVNLTISGSPRIFCVSKDTDGVNRLWEAFNPSRTDNGEPITAGLWTRMYNRIEGQRSQLHKEFRYFDAFISEVSGTVDIAGFFTGNSGGLERVLTKRMLSGVGGIDSTTEYSSTTKMKSLIPQMRYLKSKTYTTPSTVNSCILENNKSFGIDTDFQVVVVWSGRLAIKSLRTFFSVGNHDDFEGGCEADETSTTYVNEDGISGSVVPDTATEYTSTKTYDAGDGVIFSATATSAISQADADRKALGTATLAALGEYDPTGYLLTGAGDTLITNAGDAIIY